VPRGGNRRAKYRVVDGVRERLCAGCGRLVPRTYGNFYRCWDKPDGLQSRCIECVRPAMRERMRAKAKAQTQARQYAQAAREGMVSA
jgi:hypothetical protein